jgi:mannobiose 2-epimerase
MEIEELKKELKQELLDDILPYWIKKMQDEENGGFYGRIDGHEVLHKQANKGAVLNARILWTFSIAYRLFGNPKYLATAKRAYDYILSYFIDKQNGGVYWELNYCGIPVNTKKQTYAQGFCLYGFSEYYRATGDASVLEKAKELFHLIENHCLDKEKGGYLEAFTVDWKVIEDMRLSEKDANEKKTMNTHLHILEPYSNLYRIWQSPELKNALGNLIDIFKNKIISSETHHLNLFFNEDWESQYHIVSYGHDIESSWLLYEAAELLGDETCLAQVRDLSLKIVAASLEGIQADGSLIYESEPERTDKNRHWWVQAETVVGLMFAYKNTAEKDYLDKAINCWKYIKTHLLDKAHGEWYWSVDNENRANRKEDKAGFWKCPYHNARMCMEVLNLV